MIDDLRRIYGPDGGACACQAYRHSLSFLFFFPFTFFNVLFFSSLNVEPPLSSRLDRTVRSIKFMGPFSYVCAIIGGVDELEEGGLRPSMSDDACTHRHCMVKA